MARSNNTYNKKKFLAVFAFTMLVIATLQAFCKFKTAPYRQLEEEIPETAFVPTDGEVQMEEDEPLPVLPDADTIQIAIEDDLSDTLTTDTIPYMPNIRIGSRLWSYSRCFPDVQDVQLPAAVRGGIKPVSSRVAIRRLARRHKLVDISHSPFYALDSLNHSMPYLVPKAQHLLNTIAINFIDSLRSKGLPPHLPIVSSVLRTTDDVKRLQRGNKNATTNSCHCYGTTIDIAYHRFMPLTSHPNEEPTRWNDDLKFVLGEVLNDLRNQGKCYVKYERKQACFHLTAR